MQARFKVGDKVVCSKVWHTDIENLTDVHTVCRVQGPDDDDAEYIKLEGHMKAHPMHNFKADRYRAAVAGIDYDKPMTLADLCPVAHPPRVNDLYPSGHLPDGSSVQKHSAGPLYPYVLVYRDTKQVPPPASGKYDVGLIGPRIVDIAWFTSFDDAVKAAEGLKG